MSDPEVLTLDQELEVILTRYQDREEMANACKLVARHGIEPLFERWRAKYPKVPARLEDHLKAQSEFSVMVSLHTTLEKFGQQAPARQEGETLLTRALREAEEEMGGLTEEIGVDVE